MPCPSAPTFVVTVSMLLLSSVGTAGAMHPQAVGSTSNAVAFDHLKGNEWWVEVVVSGYKECDPATRVLGRDEGGSWVELRRPSWGGPCGLFVGSFHIERGHRVQFRAEYADPAGVESCWFTHPDGVEQCGDPFDATFTLVKGNEWWVQTQVTPNAGHRVGAVDVRLDAGVWKPLKLQTWGVRDWAASYHIPDGTVVQFRGTSTGGATDPSSCYQWIPPQTGGQDAAVTACPSSVPFDASFTNVKGNDWWVEVTVKANEPLAGVDARVNCAAPWKPLTLRSWGAWAASFHVPPGSVVDFQARSASGATYRSGGYVWPHATPTSACAPWPVAGSFADVRFRAEEAWSDVDGNHRVLTDGLAQFTFGSDGRWVGSCEVRRSHRSDAGWDNVTETTSLEGGPPMADPKTGIGQEESPTTIENCAKAGYPSTVTERRTRAFSLRTSSGDPIPIDAWRAFTDGGTYTWDFWWDTRQGLMLQWTISQPQADAGYSADGWLLNTDAPWS